MSGVDKTVPGGEAIEWESSLTGARHLPHRTACFLLAMGPWAWGAFFVVVPLIVLAATAVVGPEAAIAYVVVCVCLWLMIWFSSPRFANVRYQLRPRTRTLRIETEFTDPEIDQFAALIGSDEIDVDLDGVESVALIPIATHVVCRLQYRSRSFDEPDAIVLPRDRLRGVVDGFQTAGCAVPELTPGDGSKPRTRGVRPLLRVLATPVLIGFIPLYVVQFRLGIDVWPVLFGFAVLVGVLAGQYVTTRLGIRPAGTRARDWVIRWLFDLILAVLSLVAVVVATVAVGSI